MDKERAAAWMWLIAVAIGGATAAVFWRLSRAMTPGRHPTTATPSAAPPQAADRGQ
ncbi:MAG TPA: hypothetical protein VKB57_17985 [Acidimicrobiales bacterium]|nr:hypothetical protein [Acidimicrobiales bacterium]